MDTVNRQFFASFSTRKLLLGKILPINFGSRKEKEDAKRADEHRFSPRRQDPEKRGCWHLLLNTET